MNYNAAKFGCKRVGISSVGKAPPHKLLLIATLPTAAAHCDAALAVERLKGIPGF